MHKNYADYYKLAIIDFNEDQLTRRWRGTESFHSQITVAEQAFDLVRLSFGLPVKAQENEQAFRAAFKNEDAAFLMLDNLHELQVLAAISIIYLLESKQPSTLTDATALAVICIYCRGKGPTVKIRDVVNTASNYLANESVRVRAASNPPILKKLLPNADEQIEELDKLLLGNPSPSQFHTQLTTILQSFRSSIDHLTDSLRETTENFSEALNAQIEETNIVWWLFGETSKELGCSMKEVPVPASCLIIAYELSSLTKFMPGPYGAEAYLDKMLQSSKGPLPASLTIKDAIDQADADWKRRVVQSGSTWPGDLCPVHHALRCWVESNRSWAASFDKASLIKAKMKFNPLDLAIQFYQELLLLKTFSKS